LPLLPGTPIWLAKKAAPGEPPPLPRLGTQPITPWAVAAIVKARAAAGGFGGRDFGGHSLKRGALTTGGHSVGCQINNAKPERKRTMLLVA